MSITFKWPTLPTLVLFPIIVWAYVRLVCWEEAKLLERFGDKYRDYQRRMPMFSPNLREWRRMSEAMRASVGK